MDKKTKYFSFLWAGLIVFALFLTVLSLKFDNKFTNYASAAPDFTGTQLQLSNAPSNPISGAAALNLTEIQTIINNIGKWIVAIAAIVAVIFIIWGGIIWVSAGDNEGRQETAKKTIKNGIIGALIILGVGVLLQTLSNVITRNFFG